MKILDPIPLLRPDMLVKVQFLGTAPQTGKQAHGSNSNQLRHYLPTQHLSNKPKQLWSITNENQLQLISVNYGGEKDGMIEITSGLSAGMLIAINPPADATNGMAVRIEENHHD